MQNQPNHHVLFSSLMFPHFGLILSPLKKCITDNGIIQTENTTYMAIERTRQFITEALADSDSPLDERDRHFLQGEVNRIDQYTRQRERKRQEEGEGILTDESRILVNMINQQLGAQLDDTLTLDDLEGLPEWRKLFESLDTQQKALVTTTLDYLTLDATLRQDRGEEPIIRTIGDIRTASTEKLNKVREIGPKRRAFVKTMFKPPEQRKDNTP